jgi:hypothetical protein
MSADCDTLRKQQQSSDDCEAWRLDRKNQSRQSLRESVTLPRKMSALPLLIVTLVTLQARAPVPRANAIIFDTASKAADAEPVDPEKNPYSGLLSSAEDGVVFDIDGDGVPETVAWTKANSEVAFLALDWDGDGFITSGKELFGGFTLPDTSNGVAALTRIARETNGGVMRGSVSTDDPVFARLLLWTDRNHNAISEPDELRPAGELVSDIGLGYEFRNQTDEFGNVFRYRGWVHVRTAPGRNQALSGKENMERRRYRLAVDPGPRLSGS